MEAEIILQSMFYKMLFNWTATDLLTVLISNTETMSFYLKNILEDYIGISEYRIYIEYINCYRLVLISDTEPMSFLLKEYTGRYVKARIEGSKF